jgi:uncharacterized membrane protein YdjX (TVP38/TMEM64 family)
MKRYFLVMAALAASFLALFLVVEALEVPLLSDPGPWLERGGAAAAALGFGLLVADVFLPVPSSLVMVAHGAFFGVVAGTLLSLAGSLAAAWVGFWVGRRGGPWLERVIPAGERVEVEELVGRWGKLAVVVSRPVPLLAETVAVAAGVSAMGWGELTVAAFLGSVPAAFLYAVTGATAARLDDVFLVFGLVLLIAGGVWLAGRRVSSSASPRSA